MADRPILFSGPMVRALLAGAKTQTRRILKPQPEQFPIDDKGTLCEVGVIHVEGDALPRVHHGRVITAQKLKCAIGDRLYVRETWSGIYAFHDVPPSQRKSVMTPDGPLLREDLWYWADGNPDGGDFERPRPGIHMPRWASRLTLTVTDVRVERLQDISEADALAEGVERLHHGFYPYGIATFMTVFVDGKEVPAQCCTSAHDSYMLLWDSINGRGAWRENPWVAAYTFTVERGNIDQLARAA